MLVETEHQQCPRVKWYVNGDIPGEYEEFKFILEILNSFHSDAIHL